MGSLVRFYFCFYFGPIDLKFEISEKKVDLYWVPCSFIVLEEWHFISL